MRMACVHCFTIEAPDREQGVEILRGLVGKIDRASAGLNIGYEPGFINAQPQPVREAQDE